MQHPRYDAIGHGYCHTRREDPRFRARVHAALGDARTVVNVGAGAGAYEPRDRHVIAIEPSDVMAAPERVLDPNARAATSGFARMAPSVVERVVAAVARDLAGGAWDLRHGRLRGLDELDVGLRLIVATPE